MLPITKKRVRLRNPPLPQIRTFSLGRKGLAYYGKSTYYECAYYEWVQYIKGTIKYIIHTMYYIE